MAAAAINPNQVPAPGNRLVVGGATAAAIGFCVVLSSLGMYIAQCYGRAQKISVGLLSHGGVGGAILTLAGGAAWLVARRDRQEALTDRAGVQAWTHEQQVQQVGAAATQAEHHQQRLAQVQAEKEALQQGVDGAHQELERQIAEVEILAATAIRSVPTEEGGVFNRRPAEMAIRARSLHNALTISGNALRALQQAFPAATPPQVEEAAPEAAPEISAEEASQIYRVRVRAAVDTLAHMEETWRETLTEKLPIADLLIPIAREFETLSLPLPAGADREARRIHLVTRPIVNALEASVADFFLRDTLLDQIHSRGVQRLVDRLTAQIDQLRVHKPSGSPSHTPSQQHMENVLSSLEDFRDAMQRWQATVKEGRPTSQLLLPMTRAFEAVRVPLPDDADPWASFVRDEVSKLLEGMDRSVRPFTGRDKILSIAGSIVFAPKFAAIKQSQQAILAGSQ